MACKPNNTFINEWFNFTVDQKILSYSKYKDTDKGSVFLDIANEEKIDIGGFT